MLGAVISLSVQAGFSKKPLEQGPYEANWTSLSKHQPVPEWLRDAKFGIYCHWGVYSVPAYGNEQYFHYMHCDASSSEYAKGEQFLMGERERQEAIYGPLSEFGYHDFIPMFKAEHFDADLWALLFKEAGARFGGIVAEHHDGFAMWDSKVTPFCAAKMGPERDCLGEIATAVRKRGLKFFTSLHHEINYTYVTMQDDWAANNPRYAKLYGCLMDHNEWLQMWSDKCDEVIEQYSPDLLYFDAWMDQIPEERRLQMVQHYFNHAAKTGQEVAFTYKYKEFPREVGVLDHEMSLLNEIDPIPWLCDFTIADGYHKSWGYVKGMQYISHKNIIQRLIQVVSNNGQLLLNLAPMADGTIPQAQQDIMANVGVWLWSYGESIYETRPYSVSHETVYSVENAEEPEHAKKNAESEEGYRVHYTQKKDGKTLYAIFLDWPGTENTVLLKEVGLPVKQAILLSVKKNFECRFEQTAEGLRLTIPKGSRLPSDVAQVERLVLE